MTENISRHSWNNFPAEIKETFQSWIEEASDSKAPSEFLQELLSTIENNKSLSEESITRYRKLLPPLSDCERECQRVPNRDRAECYRNCKQSVIVKSFLID